MDNLTYNVPRSVINNDPPNSYYSHTKPLKIGQRVILLEDQYYAPAGSSGVIVSSYNVRNAVTVEFDSYAQPVGVWVYRLKPGSFSEAEILDEYSID